MSASVAGSRLYLDANVFIYAVELYDPYAEAVSSLFRALVDGSVYCVTSQITLAEVLPGPRRAGRAEVEEVYRQLIRSQDGLEVTPVSEEVLIRSVEVRCTSSLRLVDAIHVATAALCDCDAIVTNDRQILSASIFPAISVDSLSLP